MTDEELVAWLFDGQGPGWPAGHPDRAPGAPEDHLALRAALRLAWNTGDQRRQATVLATLRRLRRVIG